MRTYVLAIWTLAGAAAAQPMHDHGSGPGRHDMARMPGLQGRDVRPGESAEMATLFRGFNDLYRSVEHLPDGIRTMTWSTDPEVEAALVSHVTGMVARVEEGRDPGVRIQSPTLDSIFAGGTGIETEIAVGRGGVAVTQRSDDPDVVAALHAHADEVTDMVDQGMHAVHMRMMRDRAGAE